MKFDVRAFAVTCGLLAALGLFCATWWIIAFDGVTHEPTIIGRIYRSYTVSPGGSVIGMIWAFADGLVGGALFSAIYNAFTEHMPIRV